MSKPQQKKLNIPLNNMWFLTSDENQWMLCYYTEKGQPKTAAYVGSNKDVLYQCINDNEVRVDGAGQAKLDKLPFKFLDWKKEGMGHEVST
jgi:hypothetical protein